MARSAWVAPAQNAMSVVALGLLRPALLAVATLPASMRAVLAAPGVRVSRGVLPAAVRLALLMVQLPIVPASA